jgi:hypothetical protein
VARRPFVTAAQLLNYLLDRYEAGAKRWRAYPDYLAFHSVVARDGFERDLAEAAQAGFIRRVPGGGAERDQINYVELTAPDALYGYLGRTPATLLAEEAHARLVDALALHPILVDAAGSAAATWRRAGEWCGFGRQDVDKARYAFMLPQAILDNRHVDLDYRKFSSRITRTTRGTKVLEKVETAVVRLLGGILDLPSEAKPREVLYTLGIERFAPPLLISGPIDLIGADLANALPLYLGLPPKEAERIWFRRPPAYLLTIENFASFNDHLIHADPERSGATIYVGGYPSLAMQQALGVLANMVPEGTPMFHWSDIDPDGARIFCTVERAIGRPLRPHLMSPEIAEKFGIVPATKATVTPCPPNSAIARLVEYLARKDAKTLEQEELDPQIPRVCDADGLSYREAP